MTTLTQYKTIERKLEKLSPEQGYMERQRHPSFFLERTRVLFEALGNPEKNFTYIHVGGTAGKGSITVMIHSILNQAGKRVGSYLSPHVTTLAERMLINMRPASVRDVVWAWERVNRVIQDIQKNHGKKFIPSYFEATFAMSMLIFKKQRCNWLVLEVGCGGEFDATNIIPTPRVTVLTNIYLDHTQLLGHTRKKIAQTKSGIIKKGTYVLSGERDPEIRRSIKQTARQQHASCTFVTKPIHAALALTGEHQQRNAALAAQAAKKIGISRTHILKGLREARLPARFECMQEHPRVILDGAHNPAKIKALRTALGSQTYNNLFAIIGIGRNKHIRKMLKLLLPQCTNVIFTASKQKEPKPARPEALQKIARELFPHRTWQKTKNVSDAVQRALRRAQADDLILVTGSLYVAGEARKRWIPENTILKKRNLFLS